MKVYAVPNFKRKIKKLNKKQLIELKEAIKCVAENPALGKQKKGMLSDIYVYKFRMNKQLTLLAYKVETDAIVLYAIGSHENFYRDLELHLH